MEGEADGAAQTADGAIVNEYKNKKLAQGTSGGRKSSALAEGDIGVKLAYQQTEKEVKKFENSTVEGRNIYVSSEGETDIGGADISSEEETDISGKKILTTKQKNTVRESSTGFEVSVKQSGGTVSSILDAANVGKEIADDSKKGELNKGLAAAKAIGAATGLLFNDLAGAQSKQSINFSFNKSKSEVEEDTRNKVHSGGKIRIRSTEEDINLKNVDIKAKDKITLDSERDIKVSGGKRTEKREGHQLGATVHLQESAGFGAVSGGNTTVGIGGSANYETEKSSSTTNENSNIQANNLEVRSKKNTEVKGANVRAEETAAVKVGGKLTVKSEVDEYKEEKIKANAGASGSVGVSSNTIATALGNISAGGGYLWKEGQKITERTGFTAGKRMDIEVGGDLDVDSATVGSDTKKGNLDVKGEIRTKDRTTYEKSGGAVVGGSAGLTGEIGMDLEIGDKRNREVKSNSVLSFHKENISAKKVIQNGKESDIDSLKTSRIDETEVVRDEFEKGGSANLSFSVNDTKKIAGAVKGAVKNVVQKVRAHASTSDNASSSRRASNSDEANTPTRRQQDSAEDIYSKLAPEGAYSLAQKPGAGAEDGAASRRNATDPLPEAPNTARKTKSSSEDGVYETIPARNQNSDPTYSKVGPENTYSLAGKPKTTDENATYATVNKERKGTNDDTYSLAQRPQVEAGEGIKYKENELYGTGNRRNPSDSLPEVPNESRRITSPSEERIYETISENRQRFEDIYSKRGPENTYSFVKQPGAEAGEGIRYKENDIYERGPRRNANDPLPEVPGMRKSNEVSDGIYETIPARNQNSDPTYSKVGPENTYSFVQRPQVDAGNGIKYKENELYGTGIRRNPSDSLPELPNTGRRTTTLSENRVYETIPEIRQRIEEIYSRRGPENVYSFAQRPGVGEGIRYKENDIYGMGIRRNPKDPLPELPNSIRRRISLSEDRIYETIPARNQNSDSTYSTVGASGIYSLLGRSRISEEAPLYATVNKQRRGKDDDIYSKAAGEGIYSLLGRAQNSEDLKKSVRKKRETEANPYSVIDDNGTVPQNRKALAKRPLPETPNQPEEVSRKRPESPYATIEENRGIQPRSNRGNSGDYEQLPDFGTEDRGARNSRVRRSVADENSTTGDIYAKINPNTKRKPTPEEINQKRDKELTEKFGPKTTVHIDDETYATVKRTGATGEAEGVLTPRTNQGKNTAEQVRTDSSELGSNSINRKSLVDQESPYSTIKGEPNSETEAIRPRSKTVGDSDYEELPNVIPRSGTSENEAGRQTSTLRKSRKKRALTAEAADSSTSQIRPSNMEAPQLPPRNSKNKDKVHVDELGRVIVPESQLDTISLGENTYHRQLENKLHAEAVDKLTITDTSVSNTNYVPKKLTEQERDAFFDKIKREAEKRDPHKETMNKIKKIAQDPNDIPKEHVLKKLEEYTYGYNNDDVLKLVNRSVEDGTKIVAPDTLDRSKVKEGRRDLGEIFHKLQFDPQYDKARKEIDNKIFETLSKNPEFKEIMNKELAGNREGIQKLFNQVVEAKKAAFKEVIGVDIETPKLILKDESNKKVHTHGYYLNDEVNLNIVPPTNKKRVDKRENNMDLLNTIIHELTHHDQSYLAQNKDNPALKKDLQTDARLFGINQDLYVDFNGDHKTYQGYRNQPLERDAFHAGDGLSDRLMKEVYRDPSTSFGNTDYKPKPISEKERDAFFDKIRREAEKRDPHKEAVHKLKKIANDENNIPREALISKLNELRDGYSNDQVVALVNKSVQDGSKIVAPDTFDSKKLTVAERSEIGKVFNKTPLSDEYGQFRKDVDQKIFEKLKENSRFGELMNTELKGDQNKLRELFNIVSEAKTQAFKEVSGVDISVPKLEILSDPKKHKHIHGDYDGDLVRMNDVAPIKSKDKLDQNKELLNTIIHELTHHDQAHLAENRNNENLKKSLESDANIFSLNQDLYIQKGKDYKKQPLESDAFHAGDTLSERLMKEVYQDSSTSFGNTDYKPKPISEKERKKLENKAKKNYESEFTDTYNNFRKNADEKLLENLSKNSEFKKLMNGDLNGDAEKIKDLIGVISKAKKDSLEALGETNIPKSELKLKEAVATTSEKSTKAEQNLDILNNILKQYTYKSGVEETQNLVNKINGQVENKANRFKRARRGISEENGKDSGTANYVPKKLSKQEQEQLFKEARQKAKDRDTAKEAEKKLKLLAENADRIPKEHMLKAVKELAYGLSVEDATALRKKAVELGTKIHRPDMIEGFEGKNVKNMGEILKKIQFDQEYVKTREEINQKIVEKLDSNKEFHDLMKQKLSGNEEGIKKLFKMVESAKHDSLKEVTGIDGKRAAVVLNTERGPLSMKQGHYADNEVNMNAVPLLSFLRTKKKNNKEILDTIVHELTHHDQAQITRNKDRKLPEHMKQDADLMALNETYYINSDLSNFSAYKNQPLEREAFISGHKLGEQLSKLVDKGYTGPTKKIEEIVHLPSKNKNLEASRETGAAFGDSALIYGLKDGRKELLTKANKADKEKKNPIIADSYIGELNLGFEFSRLSELANKVKSGKLSEQEIDRIVNYRDPNMDSAVSDSLNRINKANTEDNKRILTELLQNETVKDSLKRMDDLNQRERDLTESLKKNEDLDLDEPTESPNYTAKQNEEIREYNQIKKSLNDARMDFFAEKTKLIAKKVLDEGGQLYFSLDGLATDTMRFNKDKTTIDMNRLKEVFNPESEHYNAVTSKELRYLYENYKDNPNLKFTIKDHVIENPLKTLEISEVKRTEEMGDSGVAREKRILPQLFKKSKTEKGPVIKHLGGEETTSHYFPLDKIVTRNADISKDMKVNLENIKKAFTPGDKHYHDSESKSLREMYKKDPTMEQTKFIIGNQVIENPFKNPELQEYIKSQQGREAQVVTKGKKTEPKKVVNPKIARRQEISNTQEPIYAQVQKRNRGQAAADSEAPNKPLPPIPVSKGNRGAANELSSNPRALQAQEKGFVKDGYYVDRVVNQSSQAPSTGEPVYADLQFGNPNSGRVRNGHVESDYAEVGKREEYLEAPTRALPPIPVSKGNRGAENGSSNNSRALQTQEKGFVKDGYYVDRVVNQTSQTPSTGEPVYADLQFRNPNSGRVRNGHVESDYAEVGRKNSEVSEETIYENLNSLQRPALPPKGVKTPMKPALPNRKPIRTKK
ncbi:hypothetical protein EPT53_02185 [Fusobacterium necrophorum]|uniref:Uncharacterized protein n=1 Tax=Fusobacterium necrophorum TaxID=859 RepID=A0A4Q2L2K3_9FUSO|nr:hypothetical protein EPT53_02185 [Fusobacterium necrophorum]